ncbi:hypothetical protein NMY22_g18149 [Coprinellus aureogranulatus]|nr:hypothetical protein NMY22_g18149 [Coprinellus aureogranulatus]
MSTPSLWSKICVFRPQLVDIPLFEFWLEKSSNCPLVLDIMQKVNDEWGSSDEAMHRVLSLAFAHSSRWRSISLLLFDDMEALVSTYPDTVLLPSLESFHLHFYKKWTTQGGLHILRMLSSSPALRSAHFGRGICPNPLLIANLPWELLHSVSLGDISLPDLLTALSLATNLESLHAPYCTRPASRSGLTPILSLRLTMSEDSTKFLRLNFTSSVSSYLTLPSYGDSASFFEQAQTWLHRLPSAGNQEDEEPNGGRNIRTKARRGDPIVFHGRIYRPSHSHTLRKPEVASAAVHLV